MVSRACRRPDDSAFLSVVGISKEGEIFDFSTCFFIAIFESLLVCVWSLELFVHINYQRKGW